MKKSEITTKKELRCAKGLKSAKDPAKGLKSAKDPAKALLHGKFPHAFALDESLRSSTL